LVSISAAESRFAEKLFCSLGYLGYKKGGWNWHHHRRQIWRFKHLQKLFCWRSPALVGLTLFFFALLCGVFACIPYWLVGYNSNGCHYRCSLFVFLLLLVWNLSSSLSLLLGLVLVICCITTSLPLFFPHLFFPFVILLFFSFRTNFQDRGWFFVGFALGGSAGFLHMTERKVIGRPHRRKAFLAPFFDDSASSGFFLFCSWGGGREGGLTFDE
jgi:hypothetical protein